MKTYDAVGKVIQIAIEDACVYLFEADDEPAFVDVSPRIARYVETALWPGQAGEVTVRMTTTPAPRTAVIRNRSAVVLAFVENLGE